MSLLTKAKVITTPTAYSDGFLHSVKPNVLENLLLQSNSFDATWNKSNTSATSGQSGYDSSSDAWLIETNTTSGNVNQIGLSVSGVVTISVYAKAGTTDWMRLSFNDSGINSRAWFDLTNGVTGSTYGDAIKASIEYLGGGWYRCSLTANISSATQVQIWPTSGDSTITTIAGDNIYIQDAQLNKGLTADQYIETTTETSPRADFTFTRNSSATRVGEDGYIQDVQIIGSELVQNGNFEEIGSEKITYSDFYYNAGGWSLVSGKWVFDGITSGSIEHPPFSVVVGQIYKVTVDVSVPSGVANFRLSSGNGSTRVFNYTDFSDGVTTFYTQVEGVNGLIVRLYASTNLSDSFTLNSISVKEVGQNWTFQSGWSMSDGKAVCDGTDAVFVYQDNVSTSGKKYRITYEIKDYVSGSVRYRANGINGISRSGNGIYTEDIVVASTQLGIQSINFNGSVDNISVKEVTDDTNLPRINYEGFTYEETLGDNLVVNGTFDGSNGWTAESGWSIQNGYAESDGTTSNLDQFNALAEGKNHKAQITVSNMTTGALSYRLGANSGDEVLNITDNGTYTAYGIAGTSTIRLRSQSGFDGRVDNVSVQEVIGDLPIYGSGKGHFLLEPQTTQLLTYSEDFSQWTTGGDTTIESGYLAPDGTNNAYKVSGTSSALQLSASLLTTTTRSIYARTVSGTGQAHLCSFNGNTNNLFTITEEWQRFDVNSAISTGSATFYAVDFRGSTDLSEIILWGANATNDQNYVTSYIPTNGSAVTRLGETCDNATQSYPSEGVLYAEIAALANDGTNRVISLNDGTANNRVALYYTPTNNQINGLYTYNGLSEAILSHSLPNATEYVKAAIRYKENNVSLWIDGVLIYTDTTATAFPSGTLSGLAFDSGGGGSIFYGKNKMVATFPYLSNDEMECLTGEGYGSFEAMALANNYTII